MTFFTLYFGRSAHTAEKKASLVAKYRKVQKRCAFFQHAVRPVKLNQIDVVLLNCRKARILGEFAGKNNFDKYTFLTCHFKRLKQENM